MFEPTHSDNAKNKSAFTILVKSVHRTLNF